MGFRLLDSLNFSPQNLEVKIERVSTLGNVLDSRILVDTVMLKDSGTFAAIITLYILSIQMIS